MFRRRVGTSHVSRVPRRVATASLSPPACYSCRRSIHEPGLLFRLFRLCVCVCVLYYNLFRKILCCITMWMYVFLVKYFDIGDSDRGAAQMIVLWCKKSSRLIYHRRSDREKKKCYAKQNGTSSNSCHAPRVVRIILLLCIYLWNVCRRVYV